MEPCTRCGKYGHDRHRCWPLPAAPARSRPLPAALAHFYVGRCQPGPAPENYQELVDELLDAQKREAAEPEARTEASVASPMQELVQALRKAKPNKAAGPDGVPYEFLRHMGPAGRGVLLHTRNKSWLNAEVPAEWKRASICPLLEPGKECTLLAAYRPVSLTSTIAKMCDRLAAARVQQLLEDMGVLHDRQAAYRRFLAGEVHATALSALIHAGKQRGERTLVLFCDAQGAFDKLDHRSQQCVWKKKSPIHNHPLPVL